MSSIRVAVKPRATNSSNAASTIAARRSAARSARLDGVFDTAGSDADAPWALSWRPDLLDLDAGLFIVST
jgi:hypothetical protein